jgi:lactoylglutathione lyase
MPRSGPGLILVPPMAFDLRIELFTDDLEAFLDFYVRVMRFAVAEDRRGDRIPYVSVRRDNVRIGAARVTSRVDQSARMIPTGAEIVLETDDVVGERDAIVAAGWPLASDLERREWGLADVRLLDPAGYFIRVTSRD